MPGNGNNLGHGGGLEEDGSAGVFKELELVDNVRPLRNNIIESVRGMPSYYEGRIKKDPIKLKQFEMQVNQNEAATEKNISDLMKQQLQ